MISHRSHSKITSHAIEIGTEHDAEEKTKSSLFSVVGIKVWRNSYYLVRIRGKRYRRELAVITIVLLASFQLLSIIDLHRIGFPRSRRNELHVPRNNRKLLRDMAHDYKTTIVTMAYNEDRFLNHKQILDGYGNMPRVLDKVIFLWNNQEHPAPKAPVDSKVPIEIMQQSQNLIINRYSKSVTESISTDSVLFVDDDVLLGENLIRDLIDTLNLERQQHQVENGIDPDQLPGSSVVGLAGDGRIVGGGVSYVFPCDVLSRTSLAAWLLQKKCWKSLLGLESDPSQDIDGREINMVVGKTMMVDKQNVVRFQTNSKIWDFVKDHGECDDIVFNASVRKQNNHQSPIFVVPLRGDWDISSSSNLRHNGGGRFTETSKFTTTMSSNNNGRINLAEGRGLSIRLGWSQMRGDCVSWTERHFGRDIWS